MEFNERLRHLRDKAGFSQSDLAKKAGLPIRSIQNWEQGQRKPRINVVLSLARALGVPVETLIADVEKGPPDRRTKPKER